MQIFCRQCSLSYLLSFLNLAKSLFSLLFRSLKWSANTFYSSDVDAAYGSFDFFLDRDKVKDLNITHQSHHSWSDFCFYNRYFGTSQIFWRILQHRGRKIGFFEFHFLFIDDQHVDSLCHGIHLFLLCCLLLLCFFPKK